MATTTTTKKADPKPKVDKLSQEELSSQYGMTWAVLKGEPELWTLFKTAYGDGKTRWTPAKFQAKFQSTKWFQNHSEAWRTARIQQLSDPKTFAARIQATQASLETLAMQQGIQIDPKKLASLSQSLYMTGKGDTREGMLSVLSSPDWVKYATVRADGGGVAGQAADELQKMAADYGYKPAKADWYQRAAYSIATDNGTLTDYQNQIKQSAASKYAAFKDQILSGQATVRDLASTYIDSMSQTLELDPDQITLDDPHIQQAMATQYDDKGAPTAKSVWQFTKDLKEDPRWQYTRNARDSITSTGLAVLKSFGFQS